MTTDPADTPDERANPAADVTSPGDPLTTGREAPSSGSFDGSEESMNRRPRQSLSGR